MIRGLYTSAWSMLANSKKMDVISNNLANVNTNAYKKDTVVFESFPSLLYKRINDTKSQLNPSGEVGTMQQGSDVGEVYTYYNQGQLIKTENKFNIAIQDTGAKGTEESGARNEAFFTLNIPDANGDPKEYYTRDGSFTINADKQLVTKDGDLVLGENGPVMINSDNFAIEADGSVIVDGSFIDKLMIKEFTNTSTLRKFGSNMVEKTDTSEEQPFSGTIQQGFIEQSTVNIVKEMVDMITVMRAYESSQKMVQIQDGTLEKAVNEVGSLR